MSVRFSKIGRQITWRPWGWALVLVLAVGWWGGPVWGDEARKAPDPAPLREEVSGVNGAPKITAISPRWGPSGWEFSLTIEGRNLAGATEVRFVPSTGIAVDGTPVVNEAGTLATIKVTILIHAPLGPRLVVVRTPAGQSSLTPDQANTFKVSFAHLH